MTIALTATMPVPHLTGVALPMSAASARRRQLAGAVLLDIRPQVARHQGSIPGAVVVEPVQLDESWLAAAELDPDCDIIVCSISAKRAIASAELLTRRGYPHVYYLAGGYTAWHNHLGER
jgi:rhodanese-related sulfurtransferase